MTLLSRIWRILTPPQRRFMVAAQSVSVVMAFSTVLGIAAIAPFFAVLGDPDLTQRAGPLHELYARLGFDSRGAFLVALGAAFVALVVVANLLNLAGTLLLSRLALRIGDDFQSALFREYLARPYLFHARTHSATLFNNVVCETARVSNGLIWNLLNLVTAAVTATFIVTSIVLLNPWLALAMIGALAGGYALIYLLIRNRLLHWGRSQTRFVTQQARIVNESLGAFKEIAVYRAQSRFAQAFERCSRAVSRTTARIQLAGQSPRNIMECVAVIGLVLLALILAGRDGLGPRLGQLTFLGFATYRLMPTLQQMFAATVRVRAELAALTAIEADLHSARKRGDAPTGQDEAWRDRPRDAICLREVSFRYSADRPPALNAVSLRIPAGSCVGLVGPNGSGKTTVIDMLAGLLTPTSGNFEVDGIQIDDGSRAAWQSRIAYVPQNVYLLAGSIEQNIAFVLAPESIDRERVRHAARLAELESLVAMLPQGLAHPIGERGIQLSGGQRQRIGIARALYADASVLLMDEATGQLDGLTEAELTQTLGTLRGRYTTVIVAHRLSSVRGCDLIFELQEGAIAHSGSYPEMLQRSAGFRRMAGLG
jgi:ABC-type multidrug transport system fused ATPase/permease subunit